MYNTSADYKTYIKKPSRSFECKITLGARTFDNEDIVQIVPIIAQPSDGFSIGNTVSQSIDITLKNDGGVYASVGVVDVEIGLKIGNSIEYIPIGTFNIDDVTKTDYTVKITAYDNMIKFETPYFSSLVNAPTLQQVVDELASITGVQFTGTVPNYTVTKLQGYTCREVLGYVTSVCGGNAYITRDGKFTIIYPTEVDCTITADNYINGQYTVEDSTYKIGMITCQNKNNSDSSDDSDDDYDSVNDKNTISVGDLSSDTMELAFENPWVTTDILNDIYNKLKNFSYLGYKMKWQGDLALDPGDIITIVDNKNVTRKAYVYANKLTYNGGLVADTSAKGETKNSNSFDTSGPSTKDIQRLSVQLLIAQKAIINTATITDLQATNARVSNLEASVATIDTALINYATITQLDAIKANIADLNASIATIDNALINKANVADLTAANATISNLSSDVANIKTLIGGNLTIDNIQSLVLTSSKVTVDNGFIKNAMIESLDATKINTGSLNTSKISVTSSDGSLLIAGATQQFKDKNGKVRIQMGQDAQGNFNFILVASDGSTTLIDGTGVKANAIADKLIKTNMVADQAITSQQINYSSFVTGFNASTNTNYINSSKVAIDLTGQTLDIAFNNMNTTVNGLQTTTSNNSTAISAIQGQISTLISNTTITTGGTTTQLKDAYNSTVATVNSLSTTIGQHTSEINANTGNITSINSSITTIQANLSSISASLSSTQSTVSNQATQISTANTSATNAVNTANTANTTANSAKTTATTASTNASNAVTTANSASSNASTALANSNTAISTANTASTNASNAVSTANKASTDVATLNTTVTNTVSRVSSLELTTSGLTTRVGNTETAISSLSIGGRNLILNGDFSKGTVAGSSTAPTSWSFFGSRTIVYGNQGKTNYNLPRTLYIGHDTVDSGINQNLNISKNTQYTISFSLGKESVNNVYTNITYYDISNNVLSTSVFNHTMNDKVQSFTFTTPSTFDHCVFIHGGMAATYGSGYLTRLGSVKLEVGNQATDWTPAPEDVDSSIQAVKDYATTTINSNVSTINQTTDSIKASVQSLQSSVSTINTTLGNKADTTTVTNVTNRVSTLESSVSGINASITTLNSNVSSVTTTANNAQSAINNLQVGTRNLFKKSLSTSNVSGATVTKDYTNGYDSACKAMRFLIGSTAGNIRFTNLISKNSYYSVSFWIKSNTLSSYSCTVDICDTNISSNTFSVTTTWQYIKLENFNVTNYSSSTYNFIDFYLPVNADVLISHLMVVEGTKATTYTPAPEDVESEITTTNSNVSTLQSSVSVLQSQIALKVEQTNIDSAVTTINGQIASTNATISSMQSSINLQLNSITSTVSQKIGNSNLLKNSSFEDTNAFSVTTTNGSPTKCSIVNYPTEANSMNFTDTALSTNIFTIQKMSGAISSTDVYTYTNLYVNVTPGKTYTISYYHAERGTISSFSSYIYTLDSNNNGVSHVSIAPSSMSGNTWSRYSMSWTCPSGVYKIQFRFGFVCSDSAWMFIDNVQVEEGTTLTNWAASTVDVVGTMVTQSPTSVMTAFNGISQYFQVSADGAKFGDFSTGGYTKMSQKGLEHVDSTGSKPYFYRTYVGSVGVDIGSGDFGYKNLTITIPSDAAALFNGYSPSIIATIQNSYTANANTVITSLGCYAYMINATTIRLYVYCSFEQLQYSNGKISTSSGYSSHADITYLLIG